MKNLRNEKKVINLYTKRIQRREWRQKCKNSKWDNIQKKSEQSMSKKYKQTNK